MIALRALLSIALLPGIVAGLVPVLLLTGGDTDVGWGLDGAPAALPVIAGALLLGCGLALIAWTVTLFATVGRGTLAPWDPPRRLVVRGPYRHLRHPMISGVLCVLLGEAVLFGSTAVLVWFACVAAVNAIYLPFVEEPDLVGRFGADYERYREHVPRWLPRLRGWDPPSPR
jgi:protein-S-isoprenylcysteine O-methyltransferase Ste14